MVDRSNVFISYAADTKSRAQELTRALESQGFQAWVDFKDLRPGERWRDELERAIGAAYWLVILVGANNRSTAWQEAQWSTALARSWDDSDKRLLPVIFGETETPPFLRDWVPIRVHLDKEPTTWTSHVLNTVQSASNDAGHYLDAESRRERVERLDDIRKATERLREGSDDSPVQLEMQSE